MAPPMMRQRMANSGTCADFHAIGAVFADGTVSGWRDHVAKLATVAETDAAAAALKRVFPSGPFTPPSEPELLGKPAPGFNAQNGGRNRHE
jgi:hypothetical protein